MKAIITGASGLIGSRFIELYGESFEKLYQLGRTRAEINSEWIEYDFSSGLPIDLPEVDVIFHFAGQTSIYKSRDNVFEDLYINTIGFLRLLESTRKYKKQAFVVLAGTSTQVGFTEELNPVNEKFSNNPITFYDISKLTAENYLLQFVREGWIKGCSLRLCNVYGALKDGMNIERGVIDKVFQRLLKGEDVSIFGNGQYVRDYIHIDDVVSAFYLAWKYKDQVDGEYFNIGTGIGIKLKDAFYLVNKLAAEVSGRTNDISIVEASSEMSLIEFRSFVADNSKFSDATGWKPRYTLEEGIRASYKKYFKD